MRAEPLTCETPITTLTDCGGCGVSCGGLPRASATCERGSCEVETCEDGFGDCDATSDNGCEQALTSLEHCGTCDQECAFAGSQTECTSIPGVCQATGCELGYDECDGNPRNGCESLNVSEHCGGCGKLCVVDFLEHVATAACTASECAITCDPGYGDCDGEPFNGCETRLDSLVHCGECGKGCSLDRKSVV